MLSSIFTQGRNIFTRALGRRTSLSGGLTEHAIKSSKLNGAHNEGTKTYDAMNFKIIDSTLREGEQFSTAYFNTQQKMEIARMLNDMGVEYIELTSAAASKQSQKDIELIANMGMKAKILTHIRCHMDDVKKAVESGVNGVNVFCGTSQLLQQNSHGKGIEHIVEKAREVTEYCLKHGVEVRFSTEDSFRSNLADVLKIYSAVDKLGVNRVGIADTVGIATPKQVAQLVSQVRGAVNCDIEFHAHNDTGCAIANSLNAIESGVTHIDTCVLGIGERNGITPLGGFLARMYSLNREEIKRRYDLKMISKVENYIAGLVNVQVPFNNYITGSSAFTHKAGVHIKAILKNPECYEILNPDDFGVERTIQFASRITGWNAIQARVEQLNLGLSAEQTKAATAKIKALADTRNVSLADVDEILKGFTMHNIPQEQLAQEQHLAQQATHVGGAASGPMAARSNVDAAQHLYSNSF